MAATKAQKNNPQKVYGKQTARGDKGEAKAASLLRRRGYSVKKSKEHPRGKADIIATKGETTRYIQVKRISSRVFATKEAARNRMLGKPFKVNLPAGYELWVFDAAGHLYIFRS